MQVLNILYILKVLQNWFFFPQQHWKKCNFQKSCIGICLDSVCRCLNSNLWSQIIPQVIFWMLLFLKTLQICIQFCSRPNLVETTAMFYTHPSLFFGNIANVVGNCLPFCETSKDASPEQGDPPNMSTVYLTHANSNKD